MIDLLCDVRVAKGVTLWPSLRGDPVAIRSHSSHGTSAPAISVVVRCQM